MTPPSSRMIPHVRTGEGRDAPHPKFAKAIFRNKETLATLRSLRDCGVIMARGSAQGRFQRMIRLGYAIGEGNRSRATYRLSERGLKFMGEL